MSTVPVKFALPRFEGPNKTNQLKKIIWNADLRNSHAGLYDLAKANKIDPSELERGQFVMFVSASQNAVKFFASHSLMVGHFRMPGHQRMPLEILKYLPQYFNGGELHYRGALREMIENKMKRIKPSLQTT